MTKIITILRGLLSVATRVDSVALLGALAAGGYWLYSHRAESMCVTYDVLSVALLVIWARLYYSAQHPREPYT